MSRFVWLMTSFVLVNLSGCKATNHQDSQNKSFFTAEQTKSISNVPAAFGSAANFVSTPYMGLDAVIDPSLQRFAEDRSRLIEILESEKSELEQMKEAIDSEDQTKVKSLVVLDLHRFRVLVLIALHLNENTTYEPNQSLTDDFLLTLLELHRNQESQSTTKQFLKPLMDELLAGKVTLSDSLDQELSEQVEPLAEKIAEATFASTDTKDIQINSLTERISEIERLVTQLSQASSPEVLNLTSSKDRIVDSTKGLQLDSGRQYKNGGAGHITAEQVTQFNLTVNVGTDQPHSRRHQDGHHHGGGHGFRHNTPPHGYNSQYRQGMRQRQYLECLDRARDRQDRSECKMRYGGRHSRW